ncbi:unnamed protein product [Closterium sp. Naga37s-1]|nr:unnamed protein product [Closterium sp. Naga37s-1]
MALGTAVNTQAPLFPPPVSTTQQIAPYFPSSYAPVTAAERPASQLQSTTLPNLPSGSIPLPPAPSSPPFSFSLPFQFSSSEQPPSSAPSPPLSSSPSLTPFTPSSSPSPSLPSSSAPFPLNSPSPPSPPSPPPLARTSSPASVPNPSPSSTSASSPPSSSPSSASQPPSQRCLFAGQQQPCDPSRQADPNAPAAPPSPPAQSSSFSPPDPTAAAAPGGAPGIRPSPPFPNSSVEPSPSSAARPIPPASPASAPWGQSGEPTANQIAAPPPQPMSGQQLAITGAAVGGVLAIGLILLLLFAALGCCGDVCGGLCGGICGGLCGARKREDEESVWMVEDKDGAALASGMDTGMGVAEQMGVPLARGVGAGVSRAAAGLPAGMSSGQVKPMGAPELRVVAEARGAAEPKGAAEPRGAVGPRGWDEPMGQRGSSLADGEQIRKKQRGIHSEAVDRSGRGTQSTAVAATAITTAVLPFGETVDVERVVIGQLSPAHISQHMRLLSHLSHPHIVDTLGYKLLAGNICLVATAHMSQGTLLQWLKGVSLVPASLLPPSTGLAYKGTGGAVSSSPPLLDWPARVQVARSVARALTFAHSCDPPLPHGALSSRHVAFGADLKPRVGGFAAARLRRLGHRRASHGNSSDDMVADMAADVAEHIASDIHSFGLILLHLLTGRDPFLSTPSSSSPPSASSSSPTFAALSSDAQRMLAEVSNES